MQPLSLMWTAATMAHVESWHAIEAGKTPKLLDFCECVFVIWRLGNEEELMSHERCKTPGTSHHHILRNNTWHYFYTLWPRLADDQSLSRNKHQLMISVPHSGNYRLYLQLFDVGCCQDSLDVNNCLAAIDLLPSDWRSITRPEASPDAWWPPLVFRFGVWVFPRGTTVNACLGRTLSRFRMWSSGCWCYNGTETYGVAYPAARDG